MRGHRAQAGQHGCGNGLHAPSHAAVAPSKAYVSGPGVLCVQLQQRTLLAICTDFLPEDSMVADA